MAILIFALIKHLAHLAQRLLTQTNKHLHPRARFSLFLNKSLSCITNLYELRRSRHFPMCINNFASGSSKASGYRQQPTMAAVNFILVRPPWSGLVWSVVWSGIWSGLWFDFPCSCLSYICIRFSIFTFSTEDLSRLELAENLSARARPGTWPCLISPHGLRSTWTCSVLLVLNSLIHLSR